MPIYTIALTEIMYKQMPVETERQRLPLLSHNHCPGNISEEVGGGALIMIDCMIGKSRYFLIELLKDVTIQIDLRKVQIR